MYRAAKINDVGVRPCLEPVNLRLIILDNIVRNMKRGYSPGLRRYKRPTLIAPPQLGIFVHAYIDISLFP